MYISLFCVSPLSIAIQTFKAAFESETKKRSLHIIISPSIAFLLPAPLSLYFHRLDFWLFHVAVIVVVMVADLKSYLKRYHIYKIRCFV